MNDVFFIASNQPQIPSTMTTTTASDDAPLGLAIVGCGQIVTHHVEAMASLSSSKIVVRALCDPSDKRREVIEALAT